MARRRQMVLLGILCALLVIVLYWNFRSPDIAPTTSSADENFAPIVAENPALRTDLLDRLKTLEYTGTHRNIFSAALPPPPAPPEARTVAPAPPPAPPPDPGPPPLVVPATFFGSVTDRTTGKREAFFTQGDDLVGPLGAGAVLLGRFRIVQIKDDSVELEEISSGRRTTQILQEPAP